MSPPELEPGSLAPGTSPLTIRLSRLPLKINKSSSLSYILWSRSPTVVSFFVKGSSPLSTPRRRNGEVTSKLNTLKSLIGLFYHFRHDWHTSRVLFLISSRFDNKWKQITDLTSTLFAETILVNQLSSLFFHSEKKRDLLLHVFKIFFHNFSWLGYRGGGGRSENPGSYKGWFFTCNNCYKRYAIKLAEFSWTTNGKIWIKSRLQQLFLDFFKGKRKIRSRASKHFPVIFSFRCSQWLPPRNVWVMKSLFEFVSNATW